MAFWKKFGKQPGTPEKVTTGRFELERDGQTAYLEYTSNGKVLGLVHTEVPPELRGSGIASSLAETAFQYARNNNLKVDVICPTVEQYVSKHPEVRDLVMR